MFATLPTTIQAQRIISVSLQKITKNKGCGSLHKNLMVSNVLHKARFVYLEERKSAMPKSSNEVTDFPYNSPSEYEEVMPKTEFSEPEPCDMECDEIPMEVDTFSKKRPVSEEETQAAVSSILPKKARTDLYEEQLRYETVILCSGCSAEVTECMCSKDRMNMEDLAREISDDLAREISHAFYIESSNMQYMHQSQGVGPPAIALSAA